MPMCTVRSTLGSGPLGTCALDQEPAMPVLEMPENTPSDQPRIADIPVVRGS